MKIKMLLFLWQSIAQTAQTDSIPCFTYKAFTLIAYGAIGTNNEALQNFNNIKIKLTKNIEHKITIDNFTVCPAAAYTI
jgi:hypothetical protein